MAVHFNFIVDDVDAENIMMAIQSMENEATERLSGVARSYVEQPLKPGEKEWWTGHRKYLGELILKMKNTRVKDT